MNQPTFINASLNPQLWDACQSGDLIAVKLLLEDEKGGVANVHSGPLHLGLEGADWALTLACKNGHVEVVKYLLMGETLLRREARHPGWGSCRYLPFSEHALIAALEQRQWGVLSYLMGQFSVRPWIHVRGMEVAAETLFRMDMAFRKSIFLKSLKEALEGDHVDLFQWLVTNHELHENLRVVADDQFSKDILFYLRHAEAPNCTTFFFEWVKAVDVEFERTCLQFPCFRSHWHDWKARQAQREKDFLMQLIQPSNESEEREKALRL